MYKAYQYKLKFYFMEFAFKMKLPFLKYLDFICRKFLGYNCNKTLNIAKDTNCNKIVISVNATSCLACAVNVAICKCIHHLLKKKIWDTHVTQKNKDNM